MTKKALLLIVGANTHPYFYPAFNQGIRGNTLFDVKFLDDLVYREVPEGIPAPKNKPWYQKHDKYVGKRRK